MKILKILFSVILLIAIAAGPDLVFGGEEDTTCPAGDDSGTAVTAPAAEAVPCADGAARVDGECPAVGGSESADDAGG